jgi:hypothetical protein
MKASSTYVVGLASGTATFGRHWDAGTVARGDVERATMVQTRRDFETHVDGRSAVCPGAVSAPFSPSTKWRGTGSETRRMYSVLNAPRPDTGISFDETQG